MLTILLLAFIIRSYALNFVGDVDIYQNNAILKAKFYYSDELKVLRYDYSDPIQMIELRDYKENIKYKYCSNCEAIYFLDDFPILKTETTDIKTIDENLNTKYSRVSDIVEYLIYNDKGELVEFKFNNAVYKITNYQTLTDTTKFIYSDFTDSCPQPVCKRVVDIIFILDESGSIAEEEWDQTIYFCINIVERYELGFDAAQVGIVGFGDFGIKHLDLTSNRDVVINKLHEIRTKQLRGGTCTGCGLMIAKTMFDNSKLTTRGQQYNPEHLAITITDGEVADPDYKTCIKTKIGSYYNFCVGCCSRSDPNRPYCWDTISSTCVTNKTFKIQSGSKCNNIKACSKGTHTQDGYDCKNCWCDSECSTIVCDSCSTYKYSTRCRQMRYDVEGCKVNGGGYVNYLENFTNSCNEIKKDDRLLSIAIGVGSYNEVQLKQISTSLIGIQTIFKLSDYSGLNDVLNQIITESCQKIQTTDDCNLDCLGFCGCNKKCYCPNCETYSENCVYNKCEVDDNNIGSTGCVIKDVECKTDLCHTYKKNNLTFGCCEYNEISCEDDKFCTVNKCDPLIGCITEINETKCEDFNGCTIDKCDNNSGCTNELMDYCSPPDLCTIIDIPCHSINQYTCTPATFKNKCNCLDPCNIPVCDKETGECKCEPMNCDLNNSCFIGYCLDGKCVSKQNKTKIEECQNNNDDCSYWYCEDSECKKQDIKCTACQVNKTFVEECENQSNKCVRYKCVDIDDEPICQEYWKMEINEDPCFGETCDPELGLISKPMDLTYSENCHIYECKNGIYEDVGVYPNETLCYSYECVNNTFKPLFKCSEYLTINSEVDKCQVLKECDDLKGCVYESVECLTDKCHDSYCDKKTGECVKVDNSTNCKTDDLCVEFECNDYLGCIYKDKECNVSNPCLIGYCDNETGQCKTEPKCKSEDKCLNVSCTISGSCILSEVVCPTPNSTCFYSVCENGTCVDKFNSQSFLDVCGNCIKTYGDIYNKSDEVCFGALTKKEFGAVIGGAAVAGIVIAALIITAIVGISSTLGVKELVKRSKLNLDSGVNNNPLYEAEENGGTNPIFLDD